MLYCSQDRRAKNNRPSGGLSHIGMPPAGKDDQGDALRQAARVNDVDKIKALISKGADVNAVFVSDALANSIALRKHRDCGCLLVPSCFSHAYAFRACCAHPYCPLTAHIHSIAMGMHVWKQRGCPGAAGARRT